MGLVISRNENQCLVIRHAGEELVVRVCRCGTGRTVLSLEGPRSFDIARSELIGREKPPSYKSNELGADCFFSVGEHWRKGHVKAVINDSDGLHYTVTDSGGQVFTKLDKDRVRVVRKEIAVDAPTDDET